MGHVLDPARAAGPRPARQARSAAAPGGRDQALTKIIRRTGRHFKRIVGLTPGRYVGHHDLTVRAVRAAVTNVVASAPAFGPVMEVAGRAPVRGRFLLLNVVAQGGDGGPPTDPAK